jgi:hypothetical protein
MNNLKAMISSTKMSIVREVEELQSITNEIKRLNIRMKRLKAEKKRVEDLILEYLDSNDQPGVRHNGTTIVCERRNKRSYKKKSAKLEDAQAILQRYGISQTKEALDDIMEALRGEPLEKRVVKVF